MIKFSDNLWLLDIHNLCLKLYFFIFLNMKLKCLLKSQQKGEPLRALDQPEAAAARLGGWKTLIIQLFDVIHPDSRSSIIHKHISPFHNIALILEFVLHL